MAEKHPPLFVTRKIGLVLNSGAALTWLTSHDSQQLHHAALLCSPGLLV